MRTPFIEKTAIMQARIEKEFSSISGGKRTAEQALGRIGIEAENVIKGAFTTKGYGAWPDIKESTKKAKGSSQVLIDTGTLKNSIHSRVNK
jgi:hypothetical protein